MNTVSRQRGKTYLHKNRQGSVTVSKGQPQNHSKLMLFIQCVHTVNTVTTQFVINMEGGGLHSSLVAYQ